MRTYLVAGNWKMNGSLAGNAELLAGVRAGRAGAAGVEILVCPPAPYLASVADAISDDDIALGAQNVSEHAAGAFTGEMAAPMLREVGCAYALVGHSERRTLYGETDAQVAAKFEAAVAGGLVPVLCVGETLEQREAGNTEAVVSAQLAAVIDRVGADGFGDAVVAYEPVWAIGTGKTATPEQAQDVHAFLRASLAEVDEALAMRTRIVYGGSMKAANAGELLAQTDIDGGLIGGASLKAEEFLAIATHARAAAGA
ncbi:MAG: triose-phosphate isomerase [Pseudomonadota bacterium]